MSGGPNFQSPIQLQIGQSVPSKFDPEIRAALDPVYGAINQLFQAFTNYAGVAPQPEEDWPQLTADMTLLAQNAGRLYVPFDQTVPLGQVVHLRGVSSVLTARKADASTNARPCRAICVTPGGVTSGDYGEVMLQGCVGGLSGMTRGTNYYLSTVAGVITATAPVAAGNIEQYLGWALSSTLLWFTPGTWIQH